MWIYKEKFLSLFWCFSPEKVSQKESFWQGTGRVVDLLLVVGGRSPGFPLRFLNTWRGAPHECRVGMGVLSPHVVSTNTEQRVALLLLLDGENMKFPPVLFWHHPSWFPCGFLWYCGGYRCSILAIKEKDLDPYTAFSVLPGEAVKMPPSRLVRMQV